MKYIQAFLFYTLKKIYSFFIYITMIFIMLIIVSIGLAVSYAKTEDTVPSKYSHLIISDLEMPLEDKFTNSLSYIEGHNFSFYDLYTALARVKDDDKIKDILINLDSTILSSSQLEELLPVFEDIKKSGKKIYAYGEGLYNDTYSLALVADEITIPYYKSVPIEIGGYRLNNMYFKDLFDKFGFKMEVLHIGSHKSFGQEFARSSASPEEIETTSRIAEARHDVFISRIAKSRKLDEKVVREKIFNGDYEYITPDQARDESLVDSLNDYNSFTTEKEIFDEDSININDYITLNKEKTNSENKIAVIYLNGDIEAVSTDLSTTNISSYSFQEKLDKALAIEGLKGIVIRINSGGGSAIEAKKIYELIRTIEVPVYISIGDMAASGGYYISSTGDKIFANKSSLVGSIGVVSVIPKAIGTYKHFGVNVSTVTKGKYVNLTDSNTVMSEEDKQIYIASLNETYQEFKDDILAYRSDVLDEESLEEIAQGKVWLGSEALNNKLIDKIGSLQDTINTLQEDLKLNNDYNVVNVYSTQTYDDIITSLKSLIPLPFFKTAIKVDFLEEHLKFILRQDGKAMYYAPIQQIEL